MPVLLKPWRRSSGEALRSFRPVDLCVDGSADPSRCEEISDLSFSSELLRLFLIPCLLGYFSSVPGILLSSKLTALLNVLVILSSGMS